MKKKTRTEDTLQPFLPSLMQVTRSEKLLKDMLDHLVTGIVVITPDMKISWANRVFKSWFPRVNFDKHPCCYKVLYSPAPSKICSFCPVIESLRSGKVVSRITDKCANGKVYHSTSTPVLDRNGRISYCIESVEDVTVYRHLEESLEDSERQYSRILDSMGEAIHVVDRGLRIILFNTVFKEFNQSLGLETEVIGRKLFDVFPFLPKTVRGEYATVFATGKPVVTREKTVLGRREIITETKKIPVFENKKVTRVMTLLRDITDQTRKDRRLEVLNKELTKSNSRLKQLVLRDSHTGLYNHHYLSEIIEAEFLRAKRQGHSLSVTMIDLDYFKSINDVYGHQFGDLVLKQFARQLKKLVRSYDIVIRFGGEEFVVISPGSDREMTLSLAQRLLDAINLYNFGNAKSVVKLKLSMAVVAYPQDKAICGMDLIEQTEQILNKAKEGGGNNVYSTPDLAGRPLTAVKEIESDDVIFLKEKIERLTKSANQSLIEAVLAFAKTIELKDHYTGEHVERTVHYALEISRALNLNKTDIERIKQAAILHDLGKIGISEKILLKRAKLTTKEFEEIKKHPRIGIDIIRPIQFLHGIIPFILYHHERWDGKGYPDGLKGEDIPVGARVIALADVFQALTSDRPYRKAFSKKEAMDIIRQGAGTQFDPEIVTVFLRLLDLEEQHGERSEKIPPVK